MAQKCTWALVADGSSARILKDITGSDQPEEIGFADDHPRLGEIMADRAGRSFRSVGKRRSGMELRSDPVRDKERAFAAMLSDTLEKHHSSGEFDALVVIAAPRMLGDLRDAFANNLRQSITREVAKNLTKLPAKDLHEAVNEIARFSAEK